MTGGTVTEIAETFRAAGLHLSDIPGSAEIYPATSAVMEVSITGPEGIVAQITCEQRRNTLYIAGPRTGGGGVTVISHGRGGHMNIVSGNARVLVSGADVIMTGGRIIAGGAVFAEPAGGGVRVTVSVPPHTPVAIDDATAGRYSLGDIDGTLDLRLKGGGDVAAGHCADARVSIQGSSDVEIASVHGQALSAAIQGSGDLTVRSGEVGHLDLTVQGSGNAVYGGTAGHASLSVMGSGDIRVNEVTGSLDDRCMGSGRIRVHAPPRRDPGTFWGGAWGERS